MLSAWIGIAPDKPSRLADVDLIRRVVVVGKLIGGEAVVLELLEILLRCFGIVLHPPEAHEHAFEVALRNGLARGPIGTGILVLRADEASAVPRDLLVRQVRHETTTTGGFGDGGIVVRGLRDHDPVRGITREHEPVVIGHHRTVCLAALRPFDDVGGGVAVVADVQCAFIGGFGEAALAWLLVPLLRVNDARVLLAVLRPRFATDLRLLACHSHQIALIHAVGEDFATDLDCGGCGRLISRSEMATMGLERHAFQQSAIALRFRDDVTEQHGE